jgi:hypothetical protein
MKRMLILEFNELSPVLMDRFIDQGVLPNFKRLRDQSQCYITRTTDDELQPWVQWVTFHVGQPQKEHRIFSLDEAHLVEAEPIWDTLSDMGHPALVFGAMNGLTRREDVDLLPDAWASRIDANTDLLRKLHYFARSMVQEHTNPVKSLSAPELAKYMLLLMRHGLRLETVAALASQVVRERIVDRDIKWRRACLFDRMFWDVFRHIWKRSDKPVGVFFGNSTAHLQHRYWRYLEVDAFSVKPEEAHMRAYAEAIRYGYEHMDRMVGEVLDDRSLEDTTLVLATALSQHANPTRVESRPHEAYRPHDFEHFLRFAGIGDFVSTEPLMTHLAWATFPSPAAAEAAVEQLRGITVDGRPAVDLELHGDRVKFWCSVTALDNEDASLSNRQGASMRFLDLFSRVGSSVLDGSHHPDGILWVSPTRRQRPATAGGAEDIPLENAKQLLLGALQS